MNKRSIKTFWSDLVRIIMIHSLIFSSVFSFSSKVYAEEEIGIGASLNRQKQIHDKVSAVKEKAGNQRTWLRGSHIQNTFKKSVASFSIYYFLTLRQKELLRQDSKKLDLAVEERVKETEKTQTGKSSTFIEVGRTYILIYLLAVIAIAKEEIGDSNVESRDIEYGKTAGKMGEAIAEIINSGEIISSVVSAGVTHTVFKKPLEIIRLALTDTNMAPLFKNLLVTMANTLVSFVGWEFGAQLWKEALNMLDFQDLSKEERAFLKDRNKVFTLVWRALKGGYPALPADQIKYKAADKILSKTIENVLSIIFVESDLRLQWIYNAIRLRVAQGNFVTLVSSMVTASAVGTTIFPLAGTYLGMMFGIAGGVGSLFIPERHKDTITTIIKDQWLDLLKSFGGGSTTNWLTAGFVEGNFSKVDKSVPLDNILTDRASYRQKVLDVYIERAYQAHMSLLAKTEKVKEYRKLNYSGKAKEKLDSEIALLTDFSAKNYQVLLVSLKNMISFYLTEAGQLDGVKTKSKISSVGEVLGKEVINSENLMTHFCTFSESILKIDYFGFFESPAAMAEIFKIESMCKINLVKPVKTYDDLDAGNKSLYDSAIKFLEKTIWSHYDEQVLSLDRLNDILTVN